MAKIHMASSGFLDPIISTVKGVGFMRPYAIVELKDKSASCNLDNGDGFYATASTQYGLDCQLY
jgi:hypothetical protein